MIKCNAIFGKLISDTITTDHIVDFSTFEETDILISLFDLLRGFPFNINQYDSKLILKAINLLGFNSLFHILQLKEHPIITLPCDFRNFSFDNFHQFNLAYVEAIISSPLLQLKNEIQLFDLIVDLILKDRKKLYLMKYFYAPLIERFLLDSFIDSITTSEVCFDFSIFIKNLFSSSFLTKEKTLSGTDISGLLAFRKSYFDLEHSNQKIDSYILNYQFCYQIQFKKIYIRQWS
jgi:hypothetical protein